MIFLTRNSEASECTMHFQLAEDSPPPMGPGMLFLQDRRGTPVRPAGASPDQLLLRAALLPARRPLVCPGDDRHALELRAANHAQHSLCHFRRVLHRQEQTPRRGRRVCRWCCDQPGSPSLLFRDDRAAKLRHSSTLGRLRLHGWHPDCSPAPTTVACCKSHGRHHQHVPTRRALRWCGKR